MKQQDGKFAMTLDEKLELIRSVPNAYALVQPRELLMRDLKFIEMRKKGKTFTQIAKKFGVSTTTVMMAIKRSAGRARRKSLLVFSSDKRLLELDAYNTKDAMEILERLGI